MTSVLLDLSVLPAPPRPLALPFPPARRAPTSLPPAGGGARGARAGLHLPAPRRSRCDWRWRRGPRSSASTAWRRWRRTACGSRGSCAAAAVSWSPAARCRPATRQPFWSTSTSSCAARASRPCASSSTPARRAPIWAPCRASCAGARRARGRTARPGARSARPRDRSPATWTRIRFPARDLLPNDALHRVRQEELRLLHHHRHEHPRLPVPLRVLQQRRLRQLLPRALARERGRRDRGRPRAGLRPHLVRRRRVHAERAPSASRSARRSAGGGCASPGSAWVASTPSTTRPPWR